MLVNKLKDLLKCVLEQGFFVQLYESKITLLPNSKSEKVLKTVSPLKTHEKVHWEMLSLYIKKKKMWEHEKVGFQTENSALQAGSSQNHV